MKKISIHTEYIELQNVLKLSGIIYTVGKQKFFLKLMKFMLMIFMKIEGDVNYIQEIK